MARKVKMAPDLARVLVARHRSLSDSLAHAEQSVSRSRCELNTATERRDNVQLELEDLSARLKAAGIDPSSKET